MEAKMMGENEGLTRETILGLMDEISPLASEYVDSVFEDALVLHGQRGSDGDGVFLKVSSEELWVFYANFPEDSSLELLQAIKQAIDPTVLPDHEICFNVHGRNEQIVQLVQSMGFALDMEGYILRRSLPDLPSVDLGELVTDVPDSTSRGDFVELFEAAYEELNRKNGWDTHSYSKAGERFIHWINELDRSQRIKSFWMHGSLIGCYIIEGSYITDLVVHPRFQNRGYGSTMLNHCVRFMREEKGVSEIFLRLVKSNTAAKRLYERHGFRTVSHFVEHSRPRT
jgi:ribosomal protein S18 acetylase RimI-like enzyme